MLMSKIWDSVYKCIYTWFESAGLIIGYSFHMNASR